MDNSLKKKRNHLRVGTRPSQKTKTFLIGKELKTKDLHHTAAERASGPTTKPNPKPELKTPNSRSREASQAAGAAIRAVWFGFIAGSACRLNGGHIDSR